MKKRIILIAVIAAAVTAAVIWTGVGSKSAAPAAGTAASAKKTAAKKAEAKKTPDQAPNPFRELQEGDIVEFGSYEQDGDKSNGPEPIKWAVLEKTDKDALLLTCKALEQKPYNTVMKKITWENCSLRKWLNGAFYKKAFDSSEKEYIITSHLINEDNPKFKTDGGKDTDDKVFLLSIAEAEKYTAGKRFEYCMPTEFLIHKSIYPDSCTCWMLRSPGQTGDMVACVGEGAVEYSGTLLGVPDFVMPVVAVKKDVSFDDFGIGIRPAVRVTIQ